MKAFTPNHTQKLRRHHPNDIIIIYSKYEDVKDDNHPDYVSKFFPQWVGTDYVNDRTGITIPLNELILCTYPQMANLATKYISQVCNSKVRKILFYYSPTVIVINNMEPFLKPKTS